jgi:hypothetical protein
MANPTQGEPLPNQLSTSWAIFYNVSVYQAFKQMAAQGQSFFAFSGDNGAYTAYTHSTGDILPFAPGDYTYVTSVGGTVLTTNGPGGFWKSETTWAGSGGGPSPWFSIPDWQTDSNMSNNLGSTTMRNCPDVAMVATNLAIICGNGLSTTATGTSASTPLWAGFMALVNERAAGYGLTPVGFVNPAVYAIGQGASYDSNFHDITNGSNAHGSNTTNYHAVSGYDLCTGWGTPNGNTLVNALAQLAHLGASASLNIGNVVPALKAARNRTTVLVEHETMLKVPITVQLQPFPGGANSGPIDVFVCATDQNGNCLDYVYGGSSAGDRYFNVTSNAPVSKTLLIQAPTAGAKSKLQLKLCRQSSPGNPNQCNQMLASAESKELKVAARYQVRFNRLTGLSIASPHSDTLYVALQASLKGLSPDCTEATCKQGGPDPSHSPNLMYSTGGDYPVNGMVVGPFTLVPEVDPDIEVSFGLFNFGADYSDADRTSLSHQISDALRAERVFGPYEPYPEAMTALLLTSVNPPHWSGCDGPLAAGLFTLRNHDPGDTIATKTDGAQSYWQPPETMKIYQGSPHGDDCKISQYRVTLAVDRLSKP